MDNISIYKYAYTYLARKMLALTMRICVLQSY